MGSHWKVAHLSLDHLGDIIPSLQNEREGALVKGTAKLFEAMLVSSDFTKRY